MGGSRYSAGGGRYANGAARRKLRAWVLATQDICHICGGHVDTTLPPGLPLSPEVDEIIPVSRGGDPLDPHNVALAHRICNERRGAKLLRPHEIGDGDGTTRDW